MTRSQAGTAAAFLSRAGAGANAVGAALRGQQTQMIEMELIEVIVDLNPRGYATGPSEFVGEEFDQLVESIRTHGGLLQPIIVRPDLRPGRSGYYQLVAGERRWRAVNALGLDVILATVRSLSDQEMEVVVRDENELHQQVKEIDRRVSALHVVARHAGIQVHELRLVLIRLRDKPGDRWEPGSPELLVLEMIGHLKLPSVQTLIRSWARYVDFTAAEFTALKTGQLSEAALLSLLSLEAGPAREELFAQAVEHGWGRAEVAAAVKKIKGKAEPSPLEQMRRDLGRLMSAKSVKAMDQEQVAALELRLQALLDEFSF